MSYLGNNTDHNAEVFKTTKDRFSGNGSATAFTLSAVPANAESMQVFVNNVRQDSGRAYTVSGTTLTFTEAPSSATGNIYVVFNSVIAGISQVITANTQLRTGVVTQHAMSNTASYSMGELLVGGKILLDNVGHVGIGTTSPTTFSGYTTLHHHNTGGDAIHLIQSDGGIISQTIVNDASSAVTHGARSNHAYRITTNDTERLRILTDGKVGIGVTTPDAKLNVYQAAVGGTGYQNGIRLHAVSGIDSRWFEGGGSDMGIGTHSNHSFALRTNNSAKLTIAAGGNVGIGVTAPDGLLHVHTATAGSVTANSVGDDLVVENNTHGGISILTPDANYGVLYFGSPTNNVGSQVSYSYDASLMQIATGIAGDSLILKADNNVTNLTLSGASGSELSTFTGDILVGHTARVNTGTNDYSQIHYSNKGNTLLLGEWSSTNASYPALRMLKSASSTIGTNAIVADGEHLGGIEFNAADGVDYISVAAAIRAYVNGTPGDSDMPGALTFDTTADGSAGTSERVRITSAGNVGIGDTSPNGRLSVAGSDTVVGSLSYVSTFRNTDAYSTTPAVGLLFQAKYNSGGVYADAGGIEVFKENATDGQYGFGLGLHTRANGGAVTERLRVNPNGFVGIGGVANPLFLSTIQGADAATNLMIQNPSGTYRFGVYTNTNQQRLSTYGTTPMTFAITESEKMRISTAGNVGIGTSSPSDKLHVEGTVDADNYKVNGAQGSDGQVLTSTGSGVAWEAAGGGAWTFISTSGDLSSGDNVSFTGIDDTYDMYALVMSSVSATAGSQILFRVSTDGSNYISTSNYRYHVSNQHDGDSGYYRINDTSAGSLRVSRTTTDAGSNANMIIYWSGHATTGQYMPVWWDGAFNGGTNGTEWWHGAGGYNQTTNVTAVRLKLTSGTFDTGRVTLYGIKHS